MEISQAMREIGDLGNTHGAAIQETCEFLAFGELPHFYRVFDDFSRAAYAHHARFSGDGDNAQVEVGRQPFVQCDFLLAQPLPGG
jgi:hypothetical protein